MIDGCTTVVAQYGRERYASRQLIERHRHRDFYAAVVLSGRYEEAGAAGRLEACAGDVLVHHPFDAHLDRFSVKDTVQALEQIINERFGVDEKPAVRWHESDDGMHVFAAGLYGLLKQDGYDRTGGNIEEWLFAAAGSGKLAPQTLHRVAARVLERDPARLWPLK